MKKDIDFQKQKKYYTSYVQSSLDSTASSSRSDLTESDSLEQSTNPGLHKYARETDSLLAKQRQQGRQALFSVYPDIQVNFLSVNLNLM